MRVFSNILAILLALCAIMSVAHVFASQGKNICIGKLTSGADPSVIPPATLAGMTNRGQGSFTLAVSVCSSATAPGSCSTQPQSYVSIANASGCVYSFDTVLQRPTVVVDGFSVMYGSSANQNTFSLTVLCNPTSNSNALVSRSEKFAVFQNKNGGNGVLCVLHSAAACASNSTKPTAVPTKITKPTGSDLPSGGSSDMPSGGSSNMPSGGGSSDLPSGNSSDLPSGGSNSNMPSGGSNSNMPSGGSNSNMPSGGSESNSDLPSGGGSSDLPSSDSAPSANSPSGNSPSAGSSSNMPMPSSGGSASGAVPSGSGSPSNGPSPSGSVNTRTPMPSGPDTAPPIPSDLPPMSGSGSS